MAEDKDKEPDHFHPDAPAGGSGPGRSRQPGSLGGGTPDSSKPHFDSPAGRYFTSKPARGQQTPQPSEPPKPALRYICLAPSGELDLSAARKQPYEYSLGSWLDTMAQAGRLGSDVARVRGMPQDKPEDRKQLQKGQIQPKFKETIGNHDYEFLAAGLDPEDPKINGARADAIIPEGHSFRNIRESISGKIARQGYIIIVEIGTTKGATKGLGLSGQISDETFREGCTPEIMEGTSKGIKRLIVVRNRQNARYIILDHRLNQGR